MDEMAFERAVLSYKDRVHSYAALMLRNPSEAQDVAQEALIRLWRHRARVEPESARMWLMRTTRNLCIDSIRKRRVRAEIPDPEATLEARQDAAPGPQQLVHAEEVGRSIREALAAMSAGDRTVLVLREVQGMPYEEIAGVLDVPLGTLKARLHRARERLRAHLGRADEATGGRLRSAGSWQKKTAGKAEP